MVDRTELFGKIRLVAIIVGMIFFGIFLGKNFNTIPVWFFGWNPQIPLVVLAMACFLIGVACGWIVNILYRKKRLEE